MKLHVRFPWQRAESRAVEPRTWHWFSQTFDPGRAAIATGSGLGPNYGTIGSVTVADTDVRKGRCSVPGCGRDRDDPIHRDGSD